MKKIIAITLSVLMLFQIINISAFAGMEFADTYYIDSANGNDANDGKSPQSAWKTVANIPTKTLDSNDKVLFCYGGSYECSNLTFTCSGTEDNPILISAYGDSKDGLPLVYTNGKTEVFRFFDCSYITVSNLEITAHNGGGIWIDTLSKESDGITLTGLKIHDIQNVDQESRDTLNLGAAAARACVMVKGLPANSEYPVNNFTVTDCEMYDCGNGISLWGSWNTGSTLWFNVDKSVPPTYNENALISDVYFHDMTAEAIIVGICKNALVTHCRSINCCQDEGTDDEGNIKFFNAAMWFWGSFESTIEYCEISRQKNKGDGMSIDFDSWSNYCIYQYIYSHDNNCFICNNAKDEPQVGNTVRYCLSVNDNQLRNRFSTETGEYNFRFYNNTLINCSDINLMGLHDSFVANNIFVLSDGHSANSDFEEIKALFKWGNTYKNNCYYNTFTPVVDICSMNTVPGFTGDDYFEPLSFRLAEGSALIGAGCETEDNLNKDFFGNTISQNNIGCYGSDGIKDTGAKVNENIFEKIFRFFRSVLLIIINKIGELF